MDLLCVKKYVQETKTHNDSLKLDSFTGQAYNVLLTYIHKNKTIIDYELHFLCYNTQTDLLNLCTNVHTHA